jgi:hypothetical protein
VQSGRVGVRGYKREMEAPTRERGRLFVRPEEPRELRIRPRHLDLLSNVGRFRLALAAHLAALNGGSEQNISRESRIPELLDVVDRLLDDLATERDPPTSLAKDQNLLPTVVV